MAPVKVNFSPSYSASIGINSNHKSPAYSPNAISAGKSPLISNQPVKVGESPFIPMPVGFGKFAYMPPTETNVKSPVYNPATSPQYKQEDNNEK